MFHSRTSLESIEYGLQNQCLIANGYGLSLTITCTESVPNSSKTTNGYDLISPEIEQGIMYCGFKFGLPESWSGTFALYSLLCRHAKLSMLPNQQETDEKLSAYGVEKTAETWQSFELKSFFEKHKKFRKGLLIFVLLGTCMTIGDGVFTPAISGLAVTTVMFVTTCLMTMVMIIVWKKQILTAALFLVLFGSIELFYLSAALFKVPEGGWIPLLLSLTFMSVMFIWNYGKLKKHEFDLENKVSMNRILSLGPSLGMVRVPGIGLVYTNLITGIPAIFGHFVTNLPAFHQVLVFVCVKSVQVPYVRAEERMLVGRVGPREYHMFRCIVRYGYKDVPHENYNFENRVVAALVEYVEMEGKDTDTDTDSDNLDDNVHVPVGPAFKLPDHEERMVQSLKEIEESFAGCLEAHSSLKDESVQILKARESGIAYILGHSYAKAKKSSSIFAKFAIDVVYSFLSRNCRGTDVVLNVPHTSLLEVGMIYYV
ncbi:hypothetical protein L2E82_20483 [Cichorium intybus]|uniref:Uncharacterized protein n=1 Tax=Cichorium intybus TaxID=13427 RepID=A0ACB9DTT8_CICIN|nr:hypothetical protein L2E82_20483 [Cichorium intybus]